MDCKVCSRPLPTMRGTAQKWWHKESPVTADTGLHRSRRIHAHLQKNFLLGHEKFTVDTEILIRSLPRACGSRCGGLSSTQRCMLKKSGGVPPSKPGLARNAICPRVFTRKQEEFHETTSPPQGSSAEDVRSCTTVDTSSRSLGADEAK